MKLEKKYSAVHNWTAATGPPHGQAHLCRRGHGKLLSTHEVSNERATHSTHVLSGSCDVPISSLKLATQKLIWNSCRAGPSFVHRMPMLKKNYKTERQDIQSSRTPTAAMTLDGLELKSSHSQLHCSGLAQILTLLSAAIAGNGSIDVTLDLMSCELTAYY